MSKKEKSANEAVQEVQMMGKMAVKDMANSIDMAESLEEKRSFAVQMIQSGLLPNTLASPDHLLDEDYRDKAIGAVIAVVEYGRELSITPWIALNNMHVVEGKVVMGIHTYMGLALRNNILVDVIEDYKRVFKNEKLVDIVTTVEITRKYPGLNNIVKTHSFTKRWSEIKRAGLENRDNYKKRRELMLRTRCITEALRLYAADIFMGTYEQGEMLDADNKMYDVTEDGTVILEDN